MQEISLILLLVLSYKIDSVSDNKDNFNEIFNSYFGFLDSSLDKHFPYSKIRIKHNTCPWITNEFTTACLKREKCFKIAHKSNLINDINATHHQRNLCNLLARSLKKKYIANKN